MDQVKDHIRAPVQERSQKRVALILEAARNIIEQKGVAGLKMSEVAQTADVSIGSIYQYFPNKSAIVAALAEEVLSANTAKNEDILSEPPTSLIQLSHIAAELLDQYYLLLRQDPAFRDILLGHASDKEFLATEQDDTIANRDHIFGMSKHLFREEEHERAQSVLLLVLSFGGVAATIASQHNEEEGKAIMADAKSMLYAAWEASVLPLGVKH